ncbi:quinoprotein dehydrogenase-associated SoxYZ-like carrier [Roseibium litorale]|uniref:Quinoprotein dehydrogenase-associated SoxYZ-like carrier n=1 Tax=Roseibium litorale TaxID=2803841 RepID=A0ABR9CL23_9HYPH|nr:quinoprotein dehydrogenase-associated SoxYZ-like carrier [Roseibium litorale]MBD8891027.1 quinoprotein dehydrogenase-associated SoxYZ-like carrier [Roseibium litorale]
MPRHPLTPGLAAAALSLLLLSQLALAEDASTWKDLRPELYGSVFLAQSPEVLRLDAPYRTDNDSRTLVSAKVHAPKGLLITGLDVILDENPMPVSARLTFAQPVERFQITGTFRINGPTPVHAVATFDNGQRFMAESFVKTSGQGACAAPPGTDPKEALKTLGQMELALKTAPLAENQSASGLAAGVLNGPDKDLDLTVNIKHPSHSGMQMDQISLLYIPARFIDMLNISVNGAPYVDITGSISLSENPRLELTVPPGGRTAGVHMQDTDGATSDAEVTLPGY